MQCQQLNPIMGFKKTWLGLPSLYPFIMHIVGTTEQIGIKFNVSLQGLSGVADK
jgi:hypothetical protein